MEIKKKSHLPREETFPTNSTMFITMSTSPVSLLSLPVASHHIVASTSPLHTIHSDPKSTLNVISSSAICPLPKHCTESAPVVVMFILPIINSIGQF